MTLTTGQQLRQAREERGLSVAQVAKATHIRPHYVEALEADNFAFLPSMAHGRGFVRAYARYLNIDPVPMLDAMGGPPTVPIKAASETQAPGLSGGDAENIFREIGERLRKQREILGLSLEDVERHTHLRSHYLVALEAGRLDDLPSPVQGRGMLSNYARFLGFEPETMLLRFADGLQARLAARQAAAQAERPSRPTTRRSARILSPDLVAAGIFTILLVIFIGWAVMRVMNTRSSQQAEATPPSVADVLAQPSTTFTPDLTLSPETTGEAVAAGTGEPLLSLPPTDIPEMTATATLPPLNPAPVQIYVAVRQRAWMRVTVDGEIVFEGRATPGGAYIYSGNDRIEVLTGNGAAVQVFFNRLDLGAMGILGQVVNRIFTPDGVQTPTPTATPLGVPPPTQTSAPSPTPTITPSPTLRP
jgi:cytoskeletal protein RodZ